MATRTTGVGKVSLAICVASQAGFSHQGRLVAVTSVTMQALLVLGRLM